LRADRFNMVGYTYKQGTSSVDISVTFDAAFPAAVLGDVASALSGKSLSAAGSLGDIAGLNAFVLRALGDSDAKIREAGIAAAMHMSADSLFPVMQNYLDTDGDGEKDADRADRTAAGIAIVMGGLAAKSGNADMAKKVGHFNAITIPVYSGPDTISSTF
jgi:hypothetical protein